MKNEILNGAHERLATVATFLDDIKNAGMVISEENRIPEKLICENWQAAF